MGTVGSFRVRKQMSGRAVLPMYVHSSAFSRSWWTEKLALARWDNLEKVRAARQGEDLEGKAILAKRRRIQFGTYVPHTRIQSRTLMHTEKQTMVSRKQTPEPRETQSPASRAASENCYACARHTAAKASERKGTGRGGHITPAGALGTRRSI